MLGPSGPAEPGPFRTQSLGLVLPPRALAVSANGWYVFRPAELVVSSPDPNGRTVDVVSRATVIDFRIAVGLGRRLDLTAALPIFVDVRGAGSDALSTQKPSAISGAAFGDGRLGVRANLLSARSFRLMLRNEWSLPTGSENKYAGDGAATSTLALSAVWDYSGWVIAYETGYKASHAVRFGDLRLGSAMLNNLGFARDILPGHELTVGIESWVQPVLVSAPKSDVPNTSGATPIPAEWLLNVQWRPEFMPAWFWLGGGSALPLSHRNTAGAPFADSQFIAPSAARIRLGLGAGFLLGGQ